MGYKLKMTDTTGDEQSIDMIQVTLADDTRDLFKMQFDFSWGQPDEPEVTMRLFKLTEVEPHWLPYILNGADLMCKVHARIVSFMSPHHLYRDPFERDGGQMLDFV